MTDHPPTDILEDIGETVAYINTIIDRKVKIARLDTIEQVAKLTSSLSTGFLLLGILSTFISVFSIALGFIIAEYTGWNYGSSFLAVSGIYLFVGIILYLLRKKLFTEPIMRLVLKKIF